MQKSFLFPGCGAGLCAGDVFLSVKWLALRAGAPAAWGSFFFKLVLALVARGGFYSFGQMAMRSARARALFH